jgi:hypothetical protein
MIFGVNPGQYLTNPDAFQDISRNLQFELHSYLKSNPIGKLYDAPFDLYLDDYNAFQPDLIMAATLAQVSLLGANFANFRGFSAREAA